MKKFQVFKDNKLFKSFDSRDLAIEEMQKLKKENENVNVLLSIVPDYQILPDEQSN